MKILTTGKNFDIGASLRSHVEAQLEELSLRHFEGALRAQVTFAKERAMFNTEITLHLATGLVLQAHGAAAEAFLSFEGALGHLEKRLRRYKRRLKDHHRARKAPVRSQEAASYVIAAEDEIDGAEAGDLNPVVVAETPAQVPELTVGEAVMQLDISALPFVFFRNARDGTLNLVYRRPDGHIGWIDPAERATT